MRIAQQLYEGVDIKGNGTVGVITYLRTDSTRIADEADASAENTFLLCMGKNMRRQDRSRRMTVRDPGCARGDSSYRYQQDSGFFEGILDAGSVPFISAYLEEVRREPYDSGPLRINIRKDRSGRLLFYSSSV